MAAHHIPTTFLHAHLVPRASPYVCVLYLWPMENSSTLVPKAVLKQNKSQNFRLIHFKRFTRFTMLGWWEHAIFFILFIIFKKNNFINIYQIILVTQMERLGKLSQGCHFMSVLLMSLFIVNNCLLHSLSCLVWHASKKSASCNSFLFLSWLALRKVLNYSKSSEHAVRFILQSHIQ